MALVVQTSTPTTEEGAIWRAWTDGDQRRYWVPCPHCSEPITLSWPLMKWDNDARDSEGRWDLQRVRSTARIECPKCAGKIVDSMKTKMLREGQWIASNPNCLPGHRSYHLPALYSVRRSFGALAVKFLQDKQSLMGLQDFVNSILAEPWVEDADKEQEVKTAASDYLSGDKWDEANF
jgi:phage terminase large subunit GpA-like protein